MFLKVKYNCFRLFFVIFLKGIFLCCLDIWFGEFDWLLEWLVGNDVGFLIWELSVCIEGNGDFFFDWGVGDLVGVSCGVKDGVFCVEFFVFCSFGVVCLFVSLGSVIVFLV